MNNKSLCKLPLAYTLLVIVLIATLVTTQIKVVIANNSNNNNNNVIIYIFGESSCPYCSALKKFLKEEFPSKTCFCDISSSKDCLKGFYIILTTLRTPQAVPQTLLTANGKPYAIVIGAVIDKNFWENLTMLSDNNFRIYYGKELRSLIKLSNKTNTALLEAITLASRQCPISKTQASVTSQSIQQATQATSTRSKRELTKEISPKYMEMEAAKIAITTISLALIDSINPCVLSIYLLLLVGVLATRKSRKSMLASGTSFVAGVFSGYMALGLGLSSGFSLITLPKWVLAFILIGYGLYVLTKTLQEKRGCPTCIAVQVTKTTNRMSKIEYWLSRGTPYHYGLGALLSITLLPCSAGPYIVYTLYVASSPILMRLLLLTAYNIIFISPMIIILLLVASLGSRKAIENYLYGRSVIYVKMLASLALIAIGIYYIMS